MSMEDVVPRRKSVDGNLWTEIIALCILSIYVPIYAVKQRQILSNDTGL